MQVTRVQPTTQGSRSSLSCTNSRVFTSEDGVIFKFPPSTRSIHHNFASSRLSAPGDKRPRVGRTWQLASDARPPERSSALSPPQLAGPRLGLDRPAISARHSPSRPRTHTPDALPSFTSLPTLSDFNIPRAAPPCRGRGTHTLYPPASSVRQQRQTSTDMVKALHNHNSAFAVIAATQKRL
jgi:hypothetical protein